MLVNIAVIAMAGIHQLWWFDPVKRTAGVYAGTTVEALRGIDLDVGEGEYVAIMGPSGSGKSTLMNLIGCLDTPSGGQYLCDGIDVATLDAEALAELRRDKIGFVFQGFHLLPRMTALENVAMPLGYARVPNEARHDRAREALEAVGLGNRGGHRPSELSGGQQRRLALQPAHQQAVDVQHHDDADEDDEGAGDAGQGDVDKRCPKETEPVDEQAHHYLAKDRQDHRLHGAETWEQQDVAEDEAHTHHAAEPQPPRQRRARCELRQRVALHNGRDCDRDKQRHRKRNQRGDDRAIAHAQAQARVCRSLDRNEPADGERDED